MVRRQVVTPIAEGATDICRPLFIPNDTRWLGAFNGVLLQLTDPNYWQQVDIADLTPELAAAAATAIIERYWDEECGMVDCADVLACLPPEGSYQPIRSGSLRVVGGVAEWSPDGGTTWTPVVNSGSTPSYPPLTPTAGADDTAKRCLAATRAMLTIAEFFKATFGAVAAGLNNTLIDMNTFLHDVNMTIFNFIWPNQYAILEAFDFFNFDFGTYMTSGTLTEEQQGLLLCLLFDNASADVEGIVTFDYQAIADNMITTMGINPGTALLLLVAYLQQAGLNRAGNVEITNTPGDCTCPDWCYTFNFTVDNGGFNVVSGQGGVYDAGLYWRAQGLATFIGLRIERVLSADTIITGYDIVWSAKDLVSLGDSGLVTFRKDGVATYSSPKTLNDCDDVTEWTARTVGSLAIEADAIQLGTDAHYNGQGCGPTNGHVRIQSFTIYGQGSNPFGESNC